MCDDLGGVICIANNFKRLVLSGKEILCKIQTVLNGPSSKPHVFRDAMLEGTNVVTHTECDWRDLAGIK